MKRMQAVHRLKSVDTSIMQLNAFKFFGVLLNKFVFVTEFLLGDDILVAPILKKGAKSRHIYLPKGFWKDENSKNSTVIRGPTWLRDYPADLDTLPYFSRVNTDNINPLPSGSKSCFLFSASTVILHLCILFLGYIY